MPMKAGAGRDMMTAKANGWSACRLTVGGGGALVGIAASAVTAAASVPYSSTVIVARCTACAM
jgi:hypothetical protein